MNTLKARPSHRMKRRKCVKIKAAKLNRSDQNKCACTLIKGRGPLNQKTLSTNSLAVPRARFHCLPQQSIGVQLEADSQRNLAQPIPDP